MFVLGPLLGLASVLVGLVVSYRFDMPSGPSIVTVAGLMLVAVWAHVG
jgi:ABC-type Mn2+/Zn2+ transport system permease subunit